MRDTGDVFAWPADHLDLFVTLQGSSRRFRRCHIASDVSQQQRNVPAFLEPGRAQPVAQPSNARLVGAALVDDPNTFEAVCLGTGGTRPRADGDGRENRDDLSSPCMSGKEHSEG